MSHAATTAPPQVASLRFLYWTTLILALLAGFYGWVGLEPAPIIALGMAFGPYFATLAWARRDAPLRGVTLVHDWGFMALLFWPVLFPWYSIKTRGWRGVRLALFIYLLILAPSLVLSLASFIRWGEVPQ
jgi:hypothetical protein